MTSIELYSYGIEDINIMIYVSNCLEEAVMDPTPEQLNISLYLRLDKLLFSLTIDF